MKRIKISCIVLLLVVSQATVRAQDKLENAFDFWVGKWDLTWKGANGKTEKGTNVITKTLDGKVIQENFRAIEGAQKGYKGVSISVFNPNTKVWYQTWMDNQGGNINFTGDFDGEKKIFKTAEQTINGVKTISRMVFHSFRKDGFTWDWESSSDGGATWNINWQINYTKAQ